VTLTKGSAEGIKRKTLRAKKLGGSQTFSVISTSSLAVFYVEQVALNRHVTPLYAATSFMLDSHLLVKSKVTREFPHNNLLTFCVKHISAPTLPVRPGQTAS
jgi:hypothetical protein